MLDIAGKHICFGCGQEFDWSVYRKEAVAPYVESQLMMKIYHSGQSEINNTKNIDDYALIETDKFQIDTVCPKCGIKNRIIFILHK
jgi:DNA-directed RNA polymerase subunit RPC12/RpoP